MVERILSLMQEKGVSGLELATATGLNKGAVSEWKTGRNKPGTEAIIKIAEYFGVSTDYLLTGHDYSYPRFSDVELLRMSSEGTTALRPILEKHNITGFGVSSIGVSVEMELFDKFTSGELIPTILELDLINATLLECGVGEDEQPEAFAKLFLVIFDKNLFESKRITIDEMRNLKHAAIVYGTDDNPKTLLYPSKRKGEGEIRNQPLSNLKASDVVEQHLIKLGLANQDGTMTEKGSKTVLDFLSGNANVLKQLIDEN